MVTFKITQIPIDRISPVKFSEQSEDKKIFHTDLGHAQIGHVNSPRRLTESSPSYISTLLTMDLQVFISLNHKFPYNSPPGLTLT